MAVRHQVRDALRPLLPKRWQVTTAWSEPDELANPLLAIKQAGLNPHPAAPHPYYVTDLTLTVVTELTDPDAAEDALDAHVELVVHALRAAGLAARFTSAKRVLYSGRWQGYDLAVEVDSELTNPLKP